MPKQGSMPVEASPEVSSSTTPTSPTMTMSPSSSTAGARSIAEFPSPLPPARPLPQRPSRSSSLSAKHDAAGATILEAEQELGEVLGKTRHAAQSFSRGALSMPPGEDGLSPILPPSTQMWENPEDDEDSSRVDEADTMDVVDYDDAETPTPHGSGSNMWPPEECEEDEESSAAPKGAWQPPPLRRLRHADVDEDDESDDSEATGCITDPSQFDDESEEGSSSESDEEDESEECSSSGNEEETTDEDVEKDEGMEEDEASVRHTAGAPHATSEDSKERTAQSKGSGVKKWGVQVQIPERNGSHSHAHGHSKESSSSSVTPGSTTTTPASNYSSTPPAAHAGGGGSKKTRKKKKSAGKLEVGQANMELMRERIRELEEDNAELKELLDLLPAVKDWERKLERKGSNLRHRLKRLQPRPLVPLSSLHVRTSGQASRGEGPEEGPDIGWPDGADSAGDTSATPATAGLATVCNETLQLQFLAQQNLKMRGEIMNLEETKVRAIRKTVAMRLRLAAYDAALLQAGVTQRTRYTLALEIDRALGTAVEEEVPKAGVPKVVEIEVPEDARMCTLGVMLPGALLGPKMQDLSARLRELRKLDLSGRLQEFKRGLSHTLYTHTQQLSPALRDLKLPGGRTLASYTASLAPPAKQTGISAVAAKERVEEALHALRAQVLEGGGDCSQTAAYSSHSGYNGYTFDAQTDSRASVKSVSEAVRASTNQEEGSGGAACQLPHQRDLAKCSRRQTPEKTFVGIPSLLASLEALLANPHTSSSKGVELAHGALMNLENLVSQSSAARRALASSGGLRTLVGVCKLALSFSYKNKGGGPRTLLATDTSVSSAASGSDGGGGGSKRLHAELSLLAMRVMLQAAAASLTIQDDLGAVGCVQVCVKYLDAAVGEQDDEAMQALGMAVEDMRACRHQGMQDLGMAVEETGALCEMSCALLTYVCKANVMNQRALLLAGGVRRMAALLASPLPGLQRAVVATLHTASASSGKEEKLFQDELHRCNAVANLLRLLRLTGCHETKQHVLQALSMTMRHCHIKNQEALRASAGIKSLVELLRSAPPDMQVHVVTALESACVGQPLSWNQLLAHRGASILSRSLYTSTSVVQAAVALLLHKAVDPATCGAPDTCEEVLVALAAADCRAALVTARSGLASRKYPVAAADAVIAALDRHDAGVRP